MYHVFLINLLAVLAARHFFYSSSRHRDVRHFLNLCTTAPPRRFFSLKCSCHCISATAAPRHLILAPPHDILGN